jgi:cytoskeletal protein CcmA (bactofilin family)
MGFFRDFKEDLSQAVNELIPDDDVDTSDQMVNTLDSEITTDNEEAENEMKEWLEGITQDNTADNISEEETNEITLEEDIVDEGIQADDSSSEEDLLENSIEEEILEEGMEDGVEDMGEKVDLNIDENLDENVDLELLDALNAEEEEQVSEKKKKSEKKVRAVAVVDEDDVTVISKGTTINGSISSDGSLDIMGSITGDVECLGKLSITGKIVGNSTAAEVYVNTERLEGSINSEGSVKVGLGTVIVGDIIATSGVIAGAVKGEIDINGPIVIDSTAIIKGNIKAKSVQINNGAVVEGFCSLSYSDVDLDNVFE